MRPLQPASDGDVPAFWQALRLPGLIDVHVHFLPPPVMARVWEYFESRGPLVGVEWPIRYQGSDAERVEQLRQLGVRRFGALPYAHKAGVATYLNDWARDFAAAHPDNLSSATFYPEPGASAEVAQRLAEGVQVFKVHVQVADFDLCDPLLDQAWGTIADAGTPVVIHVGSGPVANSHTGPEPLAELLRRHPRLCAVVAHAGAPEYGDFLELVEGHERTYLDTTMVFTDFFEQLAPYPRDLLPRLAALGDRVLLGTDFPNIPYPYAHQLASLARLDLGDDWLQSVCWHNAARLFDVPVDV